MDLYCAIDILNGGAVRLVRGEFDARTDHGDPVDLALRYVEAGARMLHVVDLDAARTGNPVNREAVLRIVDESRVPVQVGGGVRTFEDAAFLLDAGVARVVVGTTAVEEPEIVDALTARFPGQVALGIDHRENVRGEARLVATRGWGRDGSKTVEALLDRFSDAAIGALVVTAIERDGTMSGPDLEGLRSTIATTALPVIASGGVSSAGDLRSLSSIIVDAGAGVIRRVVGAVVGRALAEGTLKVQEALAACEPSG
jgi:phosphoribosylformimino-5-aminoimidazole carboxamide ribotide isomerase